MASFRNNIHLIMNNDPQGINKIKKKKRLIFDDDDFFVMKKKKPKATGAKSTESSQNTLLNSTSPSAPPHQDKHSDSRLTPPRSSDKLEDIAPSMADSVADSVADAVEVVESDSDDLDRFFHDIEANYKQKDNFEDDRLYDITIKCNTGTTQLFSVTCAGNESFGLVIAGLERKHPTRQFPLRNGVLVWIDGKLELKPFFKPSTLRIPPPSQSLDDLQSPPHTPIACLYVHHDQAVDLERLVEHENQQKSSNEDVVVVEEPAPPMAKEPDGNTSTLGFFVIGLKGKDNKRIEAEVGPQTKLRAVLMHYLKAKGIDTSQAKRARLVFDDETLDLDGVVADTELEEDFEVEVYI